MHTQGKWKVTRIDGALTDEGFSLYIESENKAIADIVMCEDAIDNAERIVQTHNSFDGLLEACKELRKRILNKMGVRNPTIVEKSNLEILESAIAEAEGE